MAYGRLTGAPEIGNYLSSVAASFLGGGVLAGGSSSSSLVLSHQIINVKDSKRFHYQVYHN